LRSIKDDAVFVNNARSWLVDSAGLMKELQKERFDAALDVFDEEPLPDDSLFRGLERTVITPHVAGDSVESRSRLVGAMVDELERFVQGEPLQHEVTPERLKAMA
jgi:phosphoglycerate dehydrogenase-like enzyme